jgi:hypothetical protein
MNTKIEDLEVLLQQQLKLNKEEEQQKNELKQQYLKLQNEQKTNTDRYYATRKRISSLKNQLRLSKIQQRIDNNDNEFSNKPHDLSILTEDREGGGSIQTLGLYKNELEALKALLRYYLKNVNDYSKSVDDFPIVPINVKSDTPVIYQVCLGYENWGESNEDSLGYFDNLEDANKCLEERKNNPYDAQGHRREELWINKKVFNVDYF